VRKEDGPVREDHDCMVMCGYGRALVAGQFQCRVDAEPRRLPASLRALAPASSFFTG
jgi:hypothetical protein